MFTCRFKILNENYLREPIICLLMSINTLFQDLVIDLKMTQFQMFINIYRYILTSINLH